MVAPTVEGVSRPDHECRIPRRFFEKILDLLRGSCNRLFRIDFWNGFHVFQTVGDSIVFDVGDRNHRMCV